METTGPMNLFSVAAFFGLGLASVTLFADTTTLEQRAQDQIKEGLTYAGSWNGMGESWCFEDPAFRERDQDFEYVELQGLSYQVNTVKTTKAARLAGYNWIAQVKFTSEKYRMLQHGLHSQSELSDWMSSNGNENPAGRQPALLKLFQGGPLVWIVVAERNGSLKWFQCDGHEPDFSRSYRSFYDVIRDRAWHQNTSEIYVILTGLLKKIAPGFHQHDLHDSTLIVRNALGGRLALRNFEFELDASVSPPKMVPSRSQWYYFARISFSGKRDARVNASGAAPGYSTEDKDASGSVLPEFSRAIYVGAKIGKLEWYDADGTPIIPDEYFSAKKLAAPDI
jgi:hypothetical protein